MGRASSDAEAPAGETGETGAEEPGSKPAKGPCENDLDHMSHTELIWRTPTPHS